MIPYLMHLIKRFTYNGILFIDSLLRELYNKLRRWNMGKKFTEYPYIAIIGDIKDSKKLKHRKSSQLYFSEVLDQLNQEYKQDLAAKFTVSMGDAFQGLLKDSSHLMTLLFQLELKMAPIEVRMGIGLGEVETKIHPENSLLIDGSCYHRARSMIEQIEKSEKQYAKSKSNILLSTGGGKNTHYEQLINTVFALQTSLKTNWTERQKQIIKVYLENEKNQYKSAKALDIGQSSVNKALGSTDFYTFSHSLAVVQDVLDQL